MSYHSEHLRMKPVLDLARKLDIATNPDQEALFEAGSAGFQVWCTPEDHPAGWEGVPMISGTFSKPCEYVGGAHWKWGGETAGLRFLVHEAIPAGDGGVSFGQAVVGGF